MYGMKKDLKLQGIGTIKNKLLKLNGELIKMFQEKIQLGNKYVKLKTLVHISLHKTIKETNMLCIIMFVFIQNMK